jgi:GNAT superfamily N-acetyltransferase
VIVAESDSGDVVAWVHVHEAKLLVSERSAEIGGLVVASPFRGRGIGRLLMLAAEEWARSKGCAVVRLRSNVVRVGAHRFYGALGYRSMKTSTAFEKQFG